MSTKKKRSISFSSRSPILKKQKGITAILRQRESCPKFNLNRIKNCYYDYEFKYKTLYNIDDQEIVERIFKNNDNNIKLHHDYNIKLHHFVIEDEGSKIHVRKYKNLDFILEYQHAQPIDGDLDDPYHYFLKGVNENDDNDDNVEYILSNNSLNQLYCSYDFKMLYFFDIKNEEINKFLTQNDITIIENLPDEIKNKLPSNSLNSSGSQSNSTSSTIGGSKCLDKRKYIKRLKNYSIEKLQNIAKNKKIRYTKQIDGKIVSIKKETLIKKLCDYKYL